LRLEGDAIYGGGERRRRIVLALLMSVRRRRLLMLPSVTPWQRRGDRISAADWQLAGRFEAVWSASFDTAAARDSDASAHVGRRR